MKGEHFLILSVFLLLHGIFYLPTHGEDASQPSETPVTIAPEPTDEILANPGMGWETFHRSNRHDRNLPSWIPSTRGDRRCYRHDHPARGYPRRRLRPVPGCRGRA